MPRKKIKIVKWTAFEIATTLYRQDRKVSIPEGELVFLNSRYQVSVRMYNPIEIFGRIIWLSIKRIDKRPIHDWRDLQRIKNELIGEEYEAVEIYPAESRLHDTANQYHLWVFADGYKLPIGFAERQVTETPGVGAAQRLFENKPRDLLTFEEMEKLSIFVKFVK